MDERGPEVPALFFEDSEWPKLGSPGGRIHLTTMTVLGYKGAYKEFRIALTTMLLLACF